MTDLKNVKISMSELLKGAAIVGPLCASILGGAWWLSGQLTALKDDNKATREEIIKIEMYLKMPVSDPHSYTLPQDPDLSKKKAPPLPNMAVTE